MDLKQIKVESDAEAMLIIRRRCKLNQFQFAEKLGISKNLLNLIENEKYPMSKKTRKKIQAFLKDEYPLLTSYKEV